MTLFFRNSYSTLVSVSYIKRFPNCPEGWLKRGWWNIGPGATVAVDGANVSAVNRFWYFHAEAADGAVWAGPVVTCVTNTAFEWCLNRCDPPTRNEGFREFDVNGFTNYTVNLVP